MEKTTTTTKQRMTGIVVSTKMEKTAVVEVHLSKRHAKYHKIYSVTKKFKVHNTDSTISEGDKVVIEACRPISKDKKFTIISKA